MLEEGVLSQALVKKNKEIDSLNKKNEDQKREYEAKIKNLMNGIDKLKKQNETMENESHDNARVKIINDLRLERKNQEQVITLLRKFIGKDVEVDKYLINEFKKNGDQRVLTYEELKIKYKNLESDYKKLKLGQTDKSGQKHYLAPKTKKAKIPDSEVQLLVVQKFKHQIEEYENQISKLKEENETLKSQKERMERMQTEMFEKLKNYNEEIGDIKSVYDIVKKDIQDDAASKINAANLKVSKLEKENFGLKERIQELIRIGEEAQKQDKENLKKLQRENDIYVKLLEAKKEEIQAYKGAIEDQKKEIDKIGSGGIIKVRKTENIKNLEEKNELKDNVSNLNETIQQKENQIKKLKDTVESLTDQLKDKESEIEMLNGKVAEFERILQKQKNSYMQDNESEYSHFS